MKLVAVIVVQVCCYFLAGGAIQVAWNASMTDLFSLPQATWLNGVGLAILFLGWKNFPSARAK